jgi:hypothetical protein
MALFVDVGALLLVEPVALVGTWLVELLLPPPQALLVTVTATVVP